MDRKIDNMKVSYDTMVGLLKEQLRLATSASEGQGRSVDLDDSTTEELDASASEHIVPPSSRAPLSPASLGTVAQEQANDLGKSAGLRKSQRVASRASEASESVLLEPENAPKGKASGKRCVEVS